MPTFAQLLDQELAGIREELTALRERTEAAEARSEKSEALLREYLDSFNDQVSTEEALRISGIASRTTLIAERQRHGTPLTFCHAGRSVTYGRAGCVAYKLAHQHQQPQAA